MLIFRSPQQIMGVLVKKYLPQVLNISGENIYHVTIMPCYDKKLEASREEFFNEVTQTRDVDCVITPSMFFFVNYFHKLILFYYLAVEIEQMLQSTITHLSETPLGSFDWPWKTPAPQRNIWAHESSGSGGYSDYIFKHALKEFFNEEINELNYNTIKNSDFREIIFERNGKALRFAIANGFRNIQNIVQKLKRGKSVYHYVEVMACPSGCLNGGAQIRPREGVHSRELIMQIEEFYKKLPKSDPENFDVQNLYQTFFDGHNSDKSIALLHTSYRMIEKNTTALNIKW